MNHACVSENARLESLLIDAVATLIENHCEQYDSDTYLSIQFDDVADWLDVCPVPDRVACLALLRAGFLPLSEAEDSLDVPIWHKYPDKPLKCDQKIETEFDDLDMEIRFVSHAIYGKRDALQAENDALRVVAK